MSYIFGIRSKKNLYECDDSIQSILKQAIQVYDFSILCGHRTEAEQNKAFASKKSKLQWPNSKHNRDPSFAVDVAPYPVDWNNTASFYYLAGIIKAIAHSYGIGIRWGGDFNMNNNFKDESFLDLGHFELME